MNETSTPFDAKAYLKHLTIRPGVYRMYDADDTLLYVGKAKNLKNRVSSYFRGRGLTNKTLALVARIQRIETTVTHSETEALLLEHTLIKQHRPPYNILLVDDKSYPYIKLTTGGDWPGLYVHRGARKGTSEYFGPYPSAGAVRESLAILQKAFKVRQCEDSVFQNRQRPCLQYQINRCKAPCVGFVSEAEYQADLEKTRTFLQGRSQNLIETLEVEMDAASANLNFEAAAEVRDQLLYLRKVQEQQFVSSDRGDVDVFALEASEAGLCVHYLMIRQGRLLGSQSFFPKPGIDEEPEQIMMSFLAQYYLARTRDDCPQTILLNTPVSEKDELEKALTEQFGRKVSLSSTVRGRNARWVELAQTNAREQLQHRISQKQQVVHRFEALQHSLSMENMPERLECFDISHSSGEATTASCVVFDQNGPNKSLYRKFNIEGVVAGDDYAAMAQAIQRRYSRLQKEAARLPDLLIVDGGKGQMKMAREVMLELGLSIPLLGVAKGETRKPGMETLFFETPDRVIQLPNHSPALHLIQHIRDEAHRFAITSHRGRRGKARLGSVLDDIPQVGATRRKALIRHFGSAQGVKAASAAEIARVKGISKDLAASIYEHLHSS
ncbi:excinuclease ABC subunit UvrC [Saccharospirillum mangrovi]|uniref:excinuclease ABC subunit UvrC n=1 Tax=Saccharospirillum mangrovi TaxID=2161747 RepID=UPI000D39F211|nr:excinuclease ABC subunit UvrC [Saccharospirillum mangrovi]